MTNELEFELNRPHIVGARSIDQLSGRCFFVFVVSGGVCPQFSWMFHLKLMMNLGI